MPLPAESVPAILPLRTGHACSEGACRERHWCRQLFERGLSHRGLPLKRKFRPRCCAKTRAGVPCITRVVPGKRRFRFHGGMSTGPKTKAGRARIAEAQRRRFRSRNVRGCQIPSNTAADGEQADDAQPHQADDGALERRKPLLRGCFIVAFVEHQFNIELEPSNLARYAAAIRRSRSSRSTASRSFARSARSSSTSAFAAC